MFYRLLSSVGSLVCAFRWCQSDAVPLFLHEGQINTNCLTERKKKISSTLMGQESSENFIYTFTKRCKFVTYVYITISLVSSYRRRAGQDLEMNQVWGTEFWLQRGFERCYGYKQVIKRDDKTMETSYLASFIGCLHFHSSKITWGKKHKVSVNMTASRV